MKEEGIKQNEKKDETPQEESQPVSNYPYEFYGDSGTKKDEQKSEALLVKSEEKKVELQKLEDRKTEDTKSKKEKTKVEDSKSKKEEKKEEKPKPKKEEKKVEIPKKKKEDKIGEVPKQKKEEKVMEELINSSGKKEEKRNSKIKKDEIKLKQKKDTNKEEKKEDKNVEIPKNQLSNTKENKIVKPKTEKRKIELPKTEEKKVEPKKEEIKIDNPKIEEKKEELKNENEKVQEIIKQPIEYKEIEKVSAPIEKNDLYEIKEENKINIENINQLPKTLLTQKTEDNYDLMMKFFRKDQHKRGDDNIDGIISYDDFSSDKFLGLVSHKIEVNNQNKNKIDDFLKRNKDDILMRQNNNKSVKQRIKQIDESTKKKLYFKNKQSEQEYFDSFYNKQIEFKNNRKQHLDKLTQKYDEEIMKICAPENKYKHNLKYFRNNEPVKLSKYCIKGNSQKNNQNNPNSQNNKNNQNSNNYIESLKEKLKENDNNNNNETGNNLKLRLQKLQSFGPNKTNSFHSNNPPEIGRAHV